MQYFKLIFLSILLFLSSSCHKDAATQDLLSEDQMVHILIRIHLSEAKTSNSMLPSDSALIYYKSMEDSVFAKMGISKKSYTDSYVYYMKNIDQMDQIYSRVIDSLSLREALRNIKY